MLIASGSNGVKTNTPAFFFSNPTIHFLQCSPLIDRGTHRTKEPCSPVGCFTPICAWTQLPDLDIRCPLRSPIFYSSHFCLPPLHSHGLTEKHHLQSPQTSRPNSERFLPSRALTSAFGVDPAANRDRGAYKEALPFLFFPTELNPVLQHFATFGE